MRIIGHLDMDAFFAAIEERSNPRFQGLPIVVGADPQGGTGRGVVSTANYAAREYGIRSAMPITQAWRLSQAAISRGRAPAVFVSGSFSSYSATSQRIMNIMRRHTPALQQRSIDEAYFDLTYTRSLSRAKEVCRAIKQAIRDTEQLTASVGIGPNKLIAKIASEYDKPDGLVAVSESDTEAFLEPLAVRAIPGIGPKAEAVLHQENIKTVLDLKRLSRQGLRDLFGKWGDDLYEKARGRDPSPLHEPRVAQSIGHNETFFRDTLSAGFLIPRLAAACEAVYARFRDERFASFRTVAVTVRFADFQTQTRSKTVPRPLAALPTLRRVATRLFLPFLDRRENPQRKLIRLLGVRLEKIA
jgi:DNA polymerase IV (DinB-like DNA polymerase)